MTQTSDVIIIGAGIAGASCASEVAADRSVTVLEMEDRPGAHSTGRSAATWLPSYGPPSIQALTRASGDFLKAPPTEFCDVAIASPRGELLLGLPGQENDIEAARRAGLTDISPERAKELVPLLRTDVINCFLYDDTCLDLDVDVLHQAFLRRLKLRGGHVLCDNAADTITRQK